MTPNEYQALARRTANPECLTNRREGLSDVGLGLAGEAGECADLIKKHLHQGHELDIKELMSELGDVCWYIAMACEVIGADFESVLVYNILKLKKRYPEGFRSLDSINRKE